MAAGRGWLVAGCGFAGRLLRVYSVPVLAAAAGGLVGGVASTLTGGPLTASLSVALGGLLYVAASLLGSPLRLAGLGLALGAHLAALSSYYSNPIPLPFLVVELDAEGRAVVGLDIVQVMLANEAVALLGEEAACAESEEEAEGLKPQPELNGETGPEGPQEAGSEGAGQPR